MTKQVLNQQMTAALSVLANADAIALETVEFINAAVIEKLSRKEVAPEPEKVKRVAKEYSTKVSPEDYLKALAERAKRMEDAGLGHFVKGTLWTATESYKQGEGY